MAQMLAVPLQAHAARRFGRRLPQSSLISSEESVRGNETTLPLDGDNTMRQPRASRRGAEGHGVPTSSSEPWPWPSAREARRRQQMLPIAGGTVDGCGPALAALEQNCRPSQLEIIGIARDQGCHLHMHGRRAC